jgi:teichuronic acid biosynthesis glycosyltransferase TuaC
MTDAVWIVPSYPWDGQPVAGTFYRTQAGALARCGVDITVACPTPAAPWPLPLMRPRWRLHASAPRTATEDGVTVVRPRYPAVPGEPSWAAPDRQIAAAVWRARASWSGAKLVHGHSAVTGLAAWRLSRRAGLPLVLTFHGGDVNVWPDENPDRLDDLRAAVRHASLVTAVSGELVARLAALTGVMGLLLPVGSDHRSLARLGMERDEARRALDLVDDRIVVLFVGNLLAAKGVRELVDALLMAGDGFLGVLVGDGPLRGYGSGDSRSRSVQYRGPVQHDEIARYMSAADVLVLPSHTEGLPSVLVEAGSVGLPVIASRVGGIPALLGDDRGTILREVSPEGIGEALAAFAAARPAARAAAARLREHVLAGHDVDVNARILADHYGRLGSSSPPKRS